MGGFSFSRVPRPRAPLSLFRRPDRLFFHLFWMAFMARNYVDFVAFHLAAEGHIRTFLMYGLPELLSHFLNIADIQVEFLSNLAIRDIE